MNTAITTAIVFACQFVAMVLGMRLRCVLPKDHLCADTKDVVKLAMGLVATMAALLLGLLVNSAKGTSDTARSEVNEIAAKVTFLDRILSAYGPEAAETRAQIRIVLEEAVLQMWPGEGKLPSQLAPNSNAGDAVYFAIQHLSPRDESQRNLKAQAVTLGLELGQLRLLLVTQSVPSISKLLLVVVVAWLVVIFFSFSLIAPPNATATLALMVSALSVSGAIFLIMELDRPFVSLIQVSSEPMLKALSNLAK